VIRENHLRLVAGSPQIGMDIQRVKSFTARAIIVHLETAQARSVGSVLALSKQA
jgi:hypothetical protein